MNQTSEIIVAGGGIVGLTAALGVAARGFETAILDAQTFTAPDKANGRVYAINQASIGLLESLGVWSLIDPARLSPYQHMHVWDGTNKAFIDFDCRMAAASQLGFIVEESVLKQALMTRLADFTHARLYPSHKVTALMSDEKGVTVTTSEHIFSGKLLLAADGAHSPCRNYLKVPLKSWPYHQEALTATIHTEKAHSQTAWQVFLPGGPLALLPLADPHQCSIVWSTAPAKVQRLSALPEEVFNQELSEAFEHRLGNLSVISRRQTFPLVMRNAEQYCGRNWVLLGDAAHTIHPLAGLGLNLGLEDVSDLLHTSEGLALAALPLKAYQRQRKHAVMKMIVLMGSLKTLFANPLLSGLRKWGLGVCNSLDPVKRVLIEQAIGKSSAGPYN